MAVEISGNGTVPLSPVTQYIVLDEDPQRPVEVIEGVDCESDIAANDAADGEEIDSPGLEAIGDGLGEEDCADGEADEDDDEIDPAAQDTENMTANPCPCHPLPNWLMNTFKARLVEASQRGTDWKPQLYAVEQTFWFPQPSPHFLLMQNDVSPQLLLNPRFFLWDPEVLCPEGIPCPHCRHQLYRHATISRPRRCVDINSTFWIIGYRYHCRYCVHPKSGKHTVTFCSWDSRILAILPPYLAKEFPARLSHRSAISKELFHFMRCCFQNGMGPKQFSDSLRVQHLLQYDTLRLQYYQYLSSRKILDGFLDRKYEAFPNFDDTSANGPHGFTPSARWLRDMYDNYVEQHRDHFNQHTAMLSANICGIDHSHKVSTE